MDAFASVDDLVARFRELDSDEQMHAEAKLEDATSMLAAEFARVGVVIDPENELQAANLKAVCCSMVRRAMANNNVDLTQSSMTAGPYTEMFTYANPSGNMYISSEERLLLGIPKRRVRIGSVMYGCGRDED